MTIPNQKFPPRLKIEELKFWDHHRAGWAYVCQLISENLASDAGILFISAVDDHIVKNGEISQPWVGFIHQVPFTNRTTFPDLARLLDMPSMKNSLRFCRGLWTLANYNRRFLQQSNIGVPVSTVIYPSPLDVQTFSWQRFNQCAKPKLLHVGYYQRRYQPFFDLKADDFNKIMLEPMDLERYRSTLRFDDAVTIVPRVANEEYDDWLSNSIIFLEFIDAGANTTVVECIARNTPILCNPVGGVTEYLGENYPLYFSNLKEAECKLANRELLLETHEYLKSMDKSRFTADSFLKQMVNSDVYRSLENTF